MVCEDIHSVPGNALGERKEKLRHQLNKCNVLEITIDKKERL